VVAHLVTGKKIEEVYSAISSVSMKAFYNAIFTLSRENGGSRIGEYNEARWVRLDEAHTMLAFKGERKVLNEAEALIVALNGREPPA
jgi:hypothetical protein